MNRACWISVVLIAVAGCGGGEVDHPDVAPAEGIVTYQGEPIEGATVIAVPMTPNPKNPGASDVTDPDGHFSLSTFPPDPGIMPGNYQIGISKTERPVTATPEVPRPPAPPTYIIPQKYNNPATSALSLDLPPEGKSDLKFELE